MESTLLLFLLILFIIFSGERSKSINRKDQIIAPSENQLLSDSKMAAAQAFGLAFRVNEKTREQYKGIYRSERSIRRKTPPGAGSLYRLP
jgi:hypothetical protein